jgi:hypothetical protein
LRKLRWILGFLVLPIFVPTSVDPATQNSTDGNAGARMNRELSNCENL